MNEDHCNGYAAFSQSKFNSGLYHLSLTKQISSILNQYPDDGQIFKELIQNADDAGASDIKFLLDKNLYSSDFLIRPGLENYQGPALLAHNNATFKSEDWDGIRLMFDSVKHQDYLKIGRFGLGMKSVFHLTDLPSIVSGYGIAFIDPHEVHFNREEADTNCTSSYIFDIHDDGDDISACPDQWIPYKHAVLGTIDQGFETKLFYSGTLFRFPLRVESKHSEISQSLYNPHRIVELFEKMKREAPLYLLFLKSIESIQLYQTNQYGEMALEFEIIITDECKTIALQEKTRFYQFVQSNKEHCINYLLEIEMRQFKDNQIFLNRTLRYQICQLFGFYGRKDLMSLSERLNVAPIVGLAHPINPDRDFHGQTFCFLPIDEDTDDEDDGDNKPIGLPMHLNAYFSVDCGRRRIKKTSNSVTECLDTKWNRILVEFLLPKAMKQIILSAISNDMYSVDQVYSMFPKYCEVKSYLQPLVSTFYQEIQRCKIVAVRNESDSIIWKFVDEVLLKPDNSSLQLTNILRDILSTDDLLFTELPPHIEESLQKFGNASIRKVTPAEISDSYKRILLSFTLIPSDCLCLLEYFLKEESYDNLIGMPLLPLANGTYVEFLQSSSQNIYIESGCHRRDLFFTYVDDKFVNTECLNPTLIKYLLALATTENTQLTLFNSSHFLNEISAILNEKPIEYPGSIYMETLWTYIDQQFPNNLESLSGLYVVSSTKNQTLYRLPFNYEAAIECKEHSMSESEKELMMTMGISVYSNIDGCVLTHPLIREFIQASNNEGKVEVILKQSRTSPEYIHEAIKQMSTQMRAELRRLLNNYSATQNENYQTFLYTYPIFEAFDNEINANVATSVDECLKTAPEYDYVFPIPCLVINKDAPYSSRLLEIVPQIEIMSIPSMLLVIANSLNYKDCSSERMENFGIRSLSFVNQDENLRSQLMRTKFVKTISSGLKEPSALLDPRDEILLELFQGEDVFPTGVFKSFENLAKLQTVGLRNCQNVTECDIISVAISIHEHPSDSIDKARALLKYFNGNATMMREMLSHIAEYNWVKLRTIRPLNYPKYLTWNSRNQVTGKFHCIRSIEYAPICGSCALFSEMYFDSLGSKPLLDEVISHLQICIEQFSLSERFWFTQMIYSIYDYLQSNFPSDEVINSIKSHGLEEWILINVPHKFVAPHVSSFEKAFSTLEPYLYFLPKELQTFRSLFVDCGVSDSVCYADILSRIQIFYDINDDYSNVDRDLRYSVSVLNHLTGQHNLADTNLAVPIVSQHFELKEANKCFYLDPEMNYEGICMKDVDKELFLLHPSISTTVAKELGIPNLIYLLNSEREICQLDADRDSNKNASNLTLLKECIGNIESELVVIKEIIRNADKSGASAIKIGYDSREHWKHHCKSLFDDEMKSLHGPALLIYYDAILDEEDFNEMCQNFAGNAGNIGRQLNLLYYFTEVPSLISGNTIAFFDPQNKYFSKFRRDETQTGIIKLDFSSRFSKNYLLSFSDQFHPYWGIFNCDLPTDLQEFKFPGTLFRLPLRNHYQAGHSEISNRVFTFQQVIDLFQSLYGCSDETLLFSETVRTMEVFYIPQEELPLKMKTIFSVEKEIIEEVQSTEPNIIDENYFVQCLSLKSGECFYLLNDADESKEIRFLISHSCSFAFNSEKFRPYGSIAIRIDKEFLPIPIKGCLFNFLPETEYDGLPFHINLCSSPHPQLNEKIDREDMIRIESLLKALITCLEAIKRKSRPLLTCEGWYSIWPRSSNDFKNDNCFVSILIKEFYRFSLSANQPRLFLLENCWSSFKNSIFLHDEFSKFSDKKLINKIFREINPKRLNSIELVAGLLPKDITRSLKEFDISETFHTKVYNIQRFIREILIPYKHRISVEDYHSCFLQIIPNLNQMDSGIHEFLKTNAFVPILSGDSRHFAKPSDLVDPNSKLASLYDVAEGRFPTWIYNDVPPSKGYESKGENVLNLKLRELGMMHETLSWNDLVQICQSIITSRYKTKALKICSIILELIGEKITTDDLPTEEQRSALLSSQIFPTLDSIESTLCNTQYFEDDEDWCSSKDGYLFESKDLVCFSAPVIDIDKVLPPSSPFRNMILNFFGLTNKEIPINLVETQINLIVNLIVNFHLNETDIHDVNSIITNVFLYLEKLLENKTNNNKITLNLRLLPLFYSKAESCFVKASSCSLIDLHIPPYFYRLDVSYQSKYPKLLSFLEVPDYLSVEDYSSILLSIYHQSQGEPISEDILEICLSIITKICNQIEHKGIETSTLSNLFLPDSNLRLQPAELLCFDDSFSTIEENDRVVHKRIDEKCANILRIRNLNQKILSDCQSGIKFSNQDVLCSKIRKLIAHQPFDASILKEILLSAENLQVKQLSFVLDSREHSRESIFSAGWKSLQGPSLLIHFDKELSSSEIRNIFDLPYSQNSDTRTYQSCCGFNSVFKLTDVPIFLTELSKQDESLITIDPHCKFIDQASPMQQFFNVKKLEKRFSDIFHCYRSTQKCIAGFDHGSFCRLPLRTAYMSKTCKLLKHAKPITIQEIKKLFLELWSDLSKCLVFMQHLRSVKLLEILKDSTNECANEIMRCESVLTVDDTLKLETFQNKVKTRMDNWRKDDLSGFDVPMIKNGLLKQIHTRRVKRNKTESFQENWIIEEQFSSAEINASLLKEMLKKSNDFTIYPFAAVAISLTECTNPTYSGRIYRGVPTQIKTKLPIHVNANFILQYQEKKLQFSTDKMDENWNVFLVQHIIAPVYLELISKIRNYVHLHNTLESFQAWYFENLPTYHDNESIVNFHLDDVLTKAFYSQLKKSKQFDLPMISGDEMEPLLTWHSLMSESKGIYVNRFDYSFKDIRNSEKLFQEHLMLIGALKRFGMIIIDIPEKVKALLNIRKVCLRPLSSLDVIDHFKRHHSSSCELSGKSLSETFFLTIDVYSIFLDFLFGQQYDRLETLENEEMDASLEGLPLVLTFNETLRPLQNSKQLYHPAKAHLVPTRPDIFVHPILERNPIMKSLVKELNLQDLCQYLPQILPADRFKLNAVPFELLSKFVNNSWLEEVLSLLREYLASEYCDANFSLDLLFDWSLIPVVQCGEAWLIPCKHAKGVIDLMKSQSNELTLSLSKFPIYRPNYLTSSLESTLSLFIGDSNDPRDITFALSLISDHFDSVEINSSEADVLCKFFSSSIYQYDELENQSNLFRSLPIFIDICNDVTSLEENISVYTMPLKFSSFYTDITLNYEGSIIFLKNNPSYEFLYKCIGCECQDVDNIYLDIFLPYFHTLSKPALMKHMSFIKDVYQDKLHWQSLERKQELISALAKVPFIFPDDSDDNCYPANYFYNGRVDIFKLMVEASRLLPASYSHDWLEFLIELGIVNEISDEEFINFAEQISETRNGVHSRALVKHLFDGHDRSESFLNQLKSIAFLEPHLIDQRFQNLAPQFGRVNGEQPFIAFENSIFETQAMLIWTQCNILPKAYFYSNNALLKKLDIYTSAPISLVCKHLLNLSSSVKGAACNNHHEMIKDVFIPIFRFLQSSILTSDCVAMICKKNIIPLDDGSLVQPQHLVIHNFLESDEIPPYLCKLPLQLGEFEALFIQLKAQKMPNMSSYAEVLKCVYELSKGELLDPNERDMVMKATKGFLKQLKRSHYLFERDALYLPSKCGRMYASGELLFIDDPALKQRIEHLDQPTLWLPNACYDLSELFQKLPFPLRPKSLSAIISEQIQSIDVSLDTFDFYQRVVKKLSSDVLVEGIIRIVHHHDALLSLTRELDTSTLLANIKVIPVSKLITVLKFKSKPILKSELEKNVHVRFEHSKCFLYINSQVKPDDESLVLTEMSKIIMKLLNLNAACAFYIRAILDCEDMGIGRVLDRLSVREYGDIDDKFLFECGDYLPIELHHLLIQGLDFDIKLGSYIAYESYDPESKDEPVYIITKAVKISPNENNPLSSMCHIDLGGGDIVEVYMLYLFKFERVLFKKTFNKDKSNNEGTEQNETNDESSRSNSGFHTSDKGKYNHQTHESTKESPKNSEIDKVKKIKQEINSTLREAIKLPKDKFKQVVKRLLLKWHPDKNPDDVQTCTVIFQFLQSEIEKFKSIQTKEEMFQNVNRRASFHYQSSQKSDSQGPFWSNFAKKDYKNPQPAEAKRWLHQAEFDLCAAENDNSTEKEAFYEWTCFKCHQAAEKAIKGVHLARDGHYLRENNLLVLCWEDEETRSWCHELEHLGSSMAFRYPDHHSLKTPHDAYTRDHAMIALNYASLILNKARAIINND